MAKMRHSKKGFTPLENKQKYWFCKSGPMVSKSKSCAGADAEKRSLTGFTLIELIMVIVVLGFLAVAALPQYFNLTTRSRQANEQGVVGGVRAGIATQFVAAFSSGGQPSFPSGVDAIGASGTCDSSFACFGLVLPGGITDGNWTKTAVHSYAGPDGGTYTYDPTDGTFKSP